MDLQELIEIRAHGRNSADIARDSNNGTLGETIRALRGNRTRTAKGFPSPQTIKGLAQALKVSEQTVINAAAESLGLSTENPEDVRTTVVMETLEKQHGQLLVKLHRTEEERYYWQQHANTYRHRATTLTTFFERLNPITRERPYMLVGTGHQAHHMQARAGEK